MKAINTRFLALVGCLGLTLALAAPARAAPNPISPESFPELKRDTGGYWQIDFGQLASFTFNPPDTDLPPNSAPVKLQPVIEPEVQPPSRSVKTIEMTDAIPPLVRSLDRQRVSLTGFMLPIHLDHGLVTDFLLIRSRLTCCFGIPPAPNEWVVVAMSGKGVRQTMDVPLILYGTLRVGAMYEDHAYSGLYRLECEKVVAAQQ